MAYVRISRDREGEQVGIDRQEQDIRRLAAQLGITIARVFADNDISASTLSAKKRPAYEEMMALAEAGQIGAILAYSNSRLTRRPLELERLITAHNRSGVQFHTVVSGHDDLSTADGRMVARIKGDVDTAESERISERTRRAKQQARDEGRWHGGPRPYGFGRDGRTPEPAEASVIDEVSRAILDGRSVISMVRRLNERGSLSATGKPWSSRSLLRVLKRPHPGIDPEISEAVRLLLSDPTRRTTPGPARRWLLSGLARCGVCDGPLRGSASSMGPGRGTYPAYRCLGPGKHIVISAITLDEYVSMEVMARLAMPDLDDLLAPSAIADTVPLRTEATALRVRLEAYADDLDIDEQTLARRARKIRERLGEIEQQLADAVRAAPLAAFSRRDPHGVLDTWDGLDLEQRRGIVDLLMDIRIVKGARGVVRREHRWREDLPAFDPRRVQITWKGQTR